nr:RyR domain-containing protein [Hyphomonas sp. Mor2]
MADIEAISRTVHEALRAWAFAVEAREIPEWSQAPDWMRESTRESVQFIFDHPDAGAGAQHEQWMEQKHADGWVFGETRDNDKKIHPSLVPFNELPDSEQKKDKLINAIVRALW